MPSETRRTSLVLGTITVLFVVTIIILVLVPKNEKNRSGDKEKVFFKEIEIFLT